MSDHEVEIEGLKVRFPFEPYEVQRRFMTSTIRAFKEVRLLIYLSIHSFNNNNNNNNNK
jgi:hypothetical protein